MNNNGRNQTISIRVISATFVVVALAVFKPFGLDTWQWQAYVHLFFFWVIGVGVCLLTDLILKYLVRMPRSYDNGVSYIIRRNLWFQCINTPLVATFVCLYRHFVLNNRVEGNQLSLVNFIETLLIITFCSFTIGLYWRFKFRSKFLAVELEETRQMNDQLKKLQEAQPAPMAADAAPSAAAAPEPSSSASSSAVPPSPSRQSAAVRVLTLTGTTNDTVTLHLSDLLYIEAVGNYVKVCHLRDGEVRTDMLRATSKQMEDNLQDVPMIVRSHRAFLVNLAQVEQVVSHSGSMQLIMKHSHDSIPVSRSNMSQVKEAIKEI